MSDRSTLLYKIECALLDRGYTPDYNLRDIPALRLEFPGLSAQYPNMDIAALSAIASAAPTASLEDWRSPPPKLPRKPYPKRKATIPDDEVRHLRRSGMTLDAIAAIAGVSKERIRRICRSTNF